MFRLAVVLERHAHMHYNSQVTRFCRMCVINHSQIRSSAFQGYVYDYFKIVSTHFLDFSPVSHVSFMCFTPHLMSCGDIIKFIILSKNYAHVHSNSDVLHDSL